MTGDPPWWVPFMDASRRPCWAECRQGCPLLGAAPQVMPPREEWSSIVPLDGAKYDDLVRAVLENARERTGREWVIDYYRIIGPAKDGTGGIISYAFRLLPAPPKTEG